MNTPSFPTYVPTDPTVPTTHRPKRDRAHEQPDTLSLVLEGQRIKAGIGPTSAALADELTSLFDRGLTLREPDVPHDEVGDIRLEGPDGHLYWLDLTNGKLI